MSKNPLDYLQHISDKCGFILAVSQDLSYTDFFEDETLKRAIVRSLEIIGEATKKIPADQKVKWNSIQWKNMTGMRDRLIHDYMGVNYSIVWDLVKTQIPDVLKEIQIILTQLYRKEVILLIRSLYLHRPLFQQTLKHKIGL